MNHPLARRRFIQSVAALPLVTEAFISSSFSGSAPLKLSFSTLGCPKWNWQTVMDQATKLGYSGIEVRGIQGEMDLTKRPEFGAANIKATCRELQDRHLEIVDLGSSVLLHTQGQEWQKHLADGRKFIDLAEAVNCPFVRVFGDKFSKEESHEATLERVAKNFTELASHARSSKVRVLLESHGEFTDSDTLLKLLQKSSAAPTGLVWDICHTIVSGNETPAHTYEKLGKFVYHTHIKDAASKAKYVLMGEGIVPVKETVQLLAKHGYQGYYSFEWEKVWHPEIQEPEVSFPQYVEKMKEYLS